MKHILHIAFAVGAMLLPEGQATTVQSDNAKITYAQENVPLSAVVDHIRLKSGANILFKNPNDEVTLDDILIQRIQVDSAPWRKVLDLAAELAGCEVEEGQLGILFITRPAPVSFTMIDRDIKEAIDLISKVSGANIIVAPEVAGTITVRFNDVPWRAALDEAVKTLGFTVVDGAHGILRVVDPISLKAQMETVAYQLKYVRPPRAWVPVISSEFIDGGMKPPTGEVEADFLLLGSLRNVLSEGGDLNYVPESNVLLIRDTVQMHDRIKEILAQIDVEPAQVFIDVKFVSTSNTDLFDLGVDYGDSGIGISAGGGQIPITFPFDLGDGGWEKGIIANDGGAGPFTDSSLNASAETIVPNTIFGALSFTQVAATLRMMQRDTSTEVVQAPKLIAMDGKQATIFVGETIRYAEAKAVEGQAGGVSLSVSEAGSSPVEVGFQLLIEPHVVPGTDKIMLDVIPKETSLSGTGDSSLAPAGFDVFTLGASGLEGSIALPRKRSSTIVTSMLLESGQTAVIGGLTTDTNVESESRIPVLAAIPILGRLFEYESSSVERRSLVVFITPTLLRSSEDNAMLLAQELEERRRAVDIGLMGILEEDIGLARKPVGYEAGDNDKD